MRPVPFIWRPFRCNQHHLHPGGARPIACPVQARVQNEHSWPDDLFPARLANGQLPGLDDRRVARERDIAGGVFPGQLWCLEAAAGQWLAPDSDPAQRKKEQKEQQKNKDIHKSKKKEQGHPHPKS
jgi:hypothetical protein